MVGSSPLLSDKKKKKRKKSCRTTNDYQHIQDAQQIIPLSTRSICATSDTITVPTNFIGNYDRTRISVKERCLGLWSQSTKVISLNSAIQSLSSGNTVWVKVRSLAQSDNSIAESLAQTRVVERGLVESGPVIPDSYQLSA